MATAGEKVMQSNMLFEQTKRVFSQRWKTSLFARQKLVRELSIVLLIKLALLYGIVNFIVPSATAVDGSDVSTRLLNSQLPAPNPPQGNTNESAIHFKVSGENLTKAATSETAASIQQETP